MHALSLLTISELRLLQSALNSGRLLPPFSEIGLRRYCTSHSNSLASYLSLFTEAGMHAKQIAMLIEAVIADRETHPTEESLELVWSGPESNELTNRDTSVVVRELFAQATTEVLVVGFAVFQGHTVFQRLAERMTEIPHMKVKMFLDIRRARGDTTVASELVWKFATNFRKNEWPGGRLPELYYDPRSLNHDKHERSSLHAKCVVVDRKTALVTSANFTEAAQSRNIEVGTLIHSSRFAEELQQHFEALQRQGILVSVPG